MSGRASEPGGGAAPASPSGVPPDGILEELDGTPIRPPARPARVPAVRWRTAAVAAVRVAMGRPPLWAYALLAFLARGGVLVLVAPALALPTFIGLSNLVGPTSVSPEGPTPRFVALLAAAVVAVTVLAVVGTVVAAAAEVALHRATVAPDAGAATGPLPLADAGPAPVGPGPVAFGSVAPGTVVPDVAGPSTVLRVVAIRLMLVVPVVLAVALALPAWIAAAYRELTLPSDVGAPLVLRVLGGAPLASVAVVATWLAAEVVGGFAARRAALFGSPALRGLGAGLRDVVAAPFGTALTVVAALATAFISLLPAAWLVGLAWGAAAGVVRSDAGPVALLAAVAGFVGAWLAALALAGIGSALRGTLATAELLRRPARARPAHREDAAAAALRHAAGGPRVG